jgi:flagellin
MSVINTNVNSLVAQNAVNSNARNLSRAMEQLSTGKRINGAKDDAAGLSIAQVMTSQIRGLNQAIRNANDGISLLQTADGAMIEQSNMLQRMRELSVQAASDTVTETQKGFLNNEFSALRTEINRIGANTSWNDRNLLDGSGGLAGASSTMTATPSTSTPAAGAYAFQVGSSSTTVIVDIPNARTTGVTAAVTGTTNTLAGTAAIYDAVNASTIATASGARDAIAAVDTSLTAANTARSKLGAAINQLTYAADNMSNIAMNTSASRSRIEDTDYAQASAELARTQIIQQAATAMLAQANQSPQSVLALLK